MPKKYTLRKYERIKSKKLIEKISSTNNKIFHYPILIKFYISNEKANSKIKAAFAVSKKRFPKAVKRNLIRRRLKEAFRILKPNLLHSLPNKTYYLLIIYISDKIFTFEQIFKKLSLALNELSKLPENNK